MFSKMPRLRPFLCAMLMAMSLVGINLPGIHIPAVHAQAAHVTSKTSELTGADGTRLDYTLVSLLARSRSGAPRFVPYGDSITAGAVGGASTPPSSGAQQSQGESYDALAGVLAGDRVRYIHNAGVPGNTSAQILARWSTDVLPYRPDVVAVLAGTNDIASTSGITLANSEANLRAIITLIQNYGATPIMETMPPKTLSSTVTSTEILRAQNLNAWIREYAAHNRIPLVDNFKLLADPSTNAYANQYTLNIGGATGGSYTVTVATQVIGGSRVVFPATAATVNLATGTLTPTSTAANIQSALNTASARANSFVVTGAVGGPFTIVSATGYPFDLTITSNSLSGGTTATLVQNYAFSIDGIHPNHFGQEIMAKAMAAMLQSLYPASPPPLAMISDNNGGSPIALVDGSNLVHNGDFTYDAGADGTPDFWGTSSANFTRTLVAPITSDNLVGNWWQISAGTGGNGYLTTQGVPLTGVSTGDVLCFAGRIRTSGFEPPLTLPWVAPLNNYSIGFEVNTSTNRYRCCDTWSYDMADGWFYVEMTVPAGTTSVSAIVFGTIPSGSSAAVKLGQLCVTDLTTQGLVSP